MKYNSKNKPQIILIGCGGHAKSVVDTIEINEEFEIVGFIDKKESDFEYHNYKVIGNDNDLKKIYEQGITNAFVCIGFLGNNQVREKIFNKLRSIGFTLPVIVDKTAIIASDVKVGQGTFIGKNTVINVEARIGEMCIINTGAIIEHECVVGDFSHIAVGATICGGVVVGKSCLIGANATIIQNRKVENDCIIGANTVVTSDILDKRIYVTGRNQV